MKNNVAKWNLFPFEAIAFLKDHYHAMISKWFRKFSLCFRYNGVSIALANLWELLNCSSRITDMIRIARYGKSSSIWPGCYTRLYIRLVPSITAIRSLSALKCLNNLECLLGKLAGWNWQSSKLTSSVCRYPQSGWFITTGFRRSQSFYS